MNAGTALILIPAVAALIACISETRKKGQRFPLNVTLVGWTLITLAGVSAALNFWVTREKAMANAIRENLGLRQLETAIYLLMSPHVAISDPPESTDRFRVVGRYGEAGVFKGLCDIDISKEVGRTFADPEYAKSTWGAFIGERTRDGLGQLTSVQAAYGQVFGDSISSLVGQVVSHPWNEFLAASKRRAEPQVKKLLCSDQPKMRKAYEALADSYWPVLRDLENTVGRRHCHLRRALGIKDAPPLFLRSISGFIFIPDPAETESLMDKICEDLAEPPT